MQLLQDCLLKRDIERESTKLERSARPPPPPRAASGTTPARSGNQAHAVPTLVPSMTSCLRTARVVPKD
eukprot:484957-Amphidinium_carterae.1